MNDVIAEWDTDGCLTIRESPDGWIKSNRTVEDLGIEEC